MTDTARPSAFALGEAVRAEGTDWVMPSGDPGQQSLLVCSWPRVDGAFLPVLWHYCDVDLHTQC